MSLKAYAYKWTMKRASIIFIVFIIISVGLCATLLAKQPATLEEAFQLQLATLLFNICGSVLFLLAIKGFRQSLKIAYRFMSAGASMLLFGVIVIYALLAMHASDQPWAVILAEMPFMLTAAFFYIGIRTFAKLIWAETFLTNIPLVFAGAAMLGVLGGFVPGILGAEDSFDSQAAIRFANIILFVCSLVLSNNVWIRASPFYRQAFTWVLAFFTLTVFNTICGFLQEVPWMAWFGQASIILYLAAGLLLSITALQFNRVAYAAKSKPLQPGKTAASRSVDVVVFLSGFASNQEAIDPILDRLRELTAAKLPDWRPNESEQAQLAAIYLSLEDYLVNKEPLRKFDQQGLRQMIGLQFKESVNEPVFWREVPVDTLHS
jgi:hypothetical protein